MMLGGYTWIFQGLIFKTNKSTASLVEVRVWADTHNALHWPPGTITTGYFRIQFNIDESSYYIDRKTAVQKD